METEEAYRLISKNAKNKEVLFPYLNGEDLNSRPDQSPSRWIINFFDWPLNMASALSGYAGPVAEDYPDCLSIVEESVKPERATKAKDVASFPWWQFWRLRKELIATVRGMENILVGVFHTKYWSLGLYQDNIVFSHALVVFGLDGFGYFALLESYVHEVWAREYSGSLETRLRYTPSDCFETFPFPNSINGLEPVGKHYFEHRRQVMLSHQEGLTQAYNRFHEPDEFSADIKTLRYLHVEMDNAVAAAYGWSDLDLGHGFHETKQGTRFTMSETARREVLARLLKLNHERYAEEVKQGFHDKAKGKPKATARKGKKSSSSEEPMLF